MAERHSPRTASSGDEATIAEIGKEVELANALQKSGLDPHPIVYALAKAWRGAELGDNDGLYGGEDGGYTVMVAKRADHLTIVRFGKAVDSEELSPQTVLRLLRLQNRLDDDAEEIETPRALAALNSALEPERIRVFSLAEADRETALRSASQSVSWSVASARDRAHAARLFAQSQGATPKDIVVSSWGASVSRFKLFEFVENLPT